MTEVIVKVQVPLSATPAVPPGRGLVYGPGRSNITEQALPSEVLALLGDDPKGYFKAKWGLGGRQEWTVLSERMPDQPW